MKIKFILAEEFRQEANGKQTGIGIFADDTIVLMDAPRSADQPPALDRLAFMFCVTGLPDGLHTYQVQIFHPSGTPHGPPVMMGEMPTLDGLSTKLVLLAKPFVVPEFGIYRIDFSVDGEITPINFEVRAQAQAIPVTS